MLTVGVVVIGNRVVVVVVAVVVEVAIFLQIVVVLVVVVAPVTVAVMVGNVGNWNVSRGVMMMFFRQSFQQRQHRFSMPR